MKRLFFISLLFLLPFFIIGQIDESFDDLDFTNNPTWFGDTNDFVINGDTMLQLMMSSGDTSILYIEANTADSVSWEFYYKLDIDGSSPSNSNNLRVFLSADSPNLKTGVNGYYIRIGANNSEDAIELRRQDGTSNELILSGSAGSVAENPSFARIKVVRNNNAVWKLYADYDGESNFIFEGEVTDDTYNTGSYFGIFCKYGDNGSEGFFLDDIKISPLFVDDIPPLLVNVDVIDATNIDVTFSEAIELTSAEDVLNYGINNGVIILDAMIDNNDPTLVHLVTSTLTSDLTYSLSVDNLFDHANNNSSMQEINFTYFEISFAKPAEIVINEIMFDPSPVLALPNAEYIELYNRSDKSFDLSNYNITVKTTTQLLPSFTLAPNEYVILCRDTAESFLAPFGQILPYSGFTTLINTSANITLADLNGVVIDQVDYFKELIRDSGKRDGGWSIELINPDSPCESVSNNWSTSTSLLGGTPGQKNSILDQNPDVVSPNLLRVFPDTTNLLRLYFNEKLDIESANNLSNYSINNSIDILSATLQGPKNTEVLLSISPALEAGITYEVKVKSTLLDCVGNEFGLFDTQVVSLPLEIEPNDIIINEVLFNPEVGGKDFVELYNRSNKVFNLGDLFIANLMDLNDPDADAIESNYLFFPNEFIVLTAVPIDITDRYQVENPFAIVQNELPTFDDKEGNVAIYTPALLGVNIIDEFDYTDDMHYNLLDDEDGVSLERIDPNGTTQSSSNWHSAAQNVGFATPTFKNSHFVSIQNQGNEIINIESSTFSPDGDGFEDVLLINYQTDIPGFTARIDIYDAQGRPINNLVNNQLLSTEGFFKWDGLTQDGTKARIGIYILAIELFNPNGEKHSIKKTCVLAGLLD